MDRRAQRTRGPLGLLAGAGRRADLRAQRGGAQGVQHQLLEIQWYLFAAVFLLGAGYTMLRQEHVRIDVVLSRFSKPTQIKIEMFGIVFFLFPLVLVVLNLVTPLVLQAYATQEMSSNAGGLIRWPAFALVPAGFVLLGLQGLSELIKRVAFLKGLIDDPTEKKHVKSAEEELAEAILAAEMAKKGAAQ